MQFMLEFKYAFRFQAVRIDMWGDTLLSELLRYGLRKWLYPATARYGAIDSNLDADIVVRITQNHVFIA